MAGQISFAVLGPFEVRAGEQILPVQGGRAKAVLAALLLRPAGASADELIDLVWGEDHPPTARTALQNKVSQLRKTFSEAGVADALRSTEDGYLLVVDPDRFDLSRCDRLLAEARRALGDGDAGRASDAAERALGLWRGSALAGVDLPGLPAGELATLDDRHDEAVTLTIEAYIAARRPERAVAPAEALVAARPLDERAASLSATALAGSGRASDALAVLALLRRRLAEELGIDPGPALDALERAILTNDPTVVPAPDEPVVASDAEHEGRRSLSVVALRATTGGSDPEARRASGAALATAVARAAEEMGGDVLDAPAGRGAIAFGLTAAHEDDAVRATRAAIALVDERTSAGVATGEVLVLERGDERSLLSTDPVELADDLARRARPGEVLADEATVRLARGAIGAEPTEIVLVDDRGEPTSAIRISAAAEDRARRVSSPLVGREDEMEVLRGAFAACVREGTARLVTVIGPAGIGKTRLVGEFGTALGGAGLGGDRYARWVSGRCLPYGHDVTFWAIAEVIRSLADVAEADGARKTRARLSEVVGDVRDGSLVVEQLAAILGVAGAEVVPDELFLAIRRFLEAAAATAPLVVAIEDVHWAEEKLLDLVEYIASTTRGVPLLLVANGRPELIERRPSWGGGPLDALNLWLDPLPDDRCALLLDRLLGAASLDAGVRERLVGAVEGNPLFLEELVQMLVDDGYLLAEGGAWVAAPGVQLADVPLPPTVRALLEARLDRLPPGPRGVLEAAAVIGKDLSLQDLRDLRPETSAEDLAAALDDLVARDLLEARRMTRGSGRGYRFRHILLRDAAYHGASKAARARDHERFAEALEYRAADRLTEVEELVGFHLEAAQRSHRDLGADPDLVRSLGVRAAGRLGAAGRRALARDDVPAAASLLGRAAACLAPDDPKTPELGWLRSIALFHLGRFDEARSEIDRALAVAEAAADTPMVWRLRLQEVSIGVYEDPAGHPMEGVQTLAERAIAAFGAEDDSGGLSAAYRLLGESLVREGRFEEASEAYRRHREYLQLGDDPTEATAPAIVISLHGTIPVSAYVEAVRAAAAGLPRTSAELELRLGLAEAMAGHADEAREAIEQGIERAREVGSEFRLADANVHRGAALLYLGDPAEAAAAFEEAVATLERIGEQSVRSTALALLAEARYRQGLLDAALAAADASAEITAGDDPASMMAWRGVKAKILAAGGAVDEATALAREAVRIADGTELLAMAGQAHLDLADVLGAGGDDAEASVERDAAIALFVRKGVVAELRRLGVEAEAAASAG